MGYYIRIGEIGKAFTLVTMVCAVVPVTLAPIEVQVVHILGCLGAFYRRHPDWDLG